MEKVEYKLLQPRVDANHSTCMIIYKTIEARKRNEDGIFFSRKKCRVAKTTTCFSTQERGKNTFAFNTLSYIYSIFNGDWLLVLLNRITF